MTTTAIVLTVIGVLLGVFVVLPILSTIAYLLLAPLLFKLAFWSMSKVFDDS